MKDKSSERLGVKLVRRSPANEITISAFYMPQAHLPEPELFTRNGIHPKNAFPPLRITVYEQPMKISECGCLSRGPCPDIGLAEGEKLE